MTELEISTLVEELLYIRNSYGFSRKESDELATACNLLYNNRGVIAQAEQHVADVFSGRGVDNK